MVHEWKISRRLSFIAAEVLKSNFSSASSLENFHHWKHTPHKQFAAVHAIFYSSVFLFKVWFQTQNKICHSSTRLTWVVPPNKLSYTRTLICFTCKVKAVWVGLSKWGCQHFREKDRPLLFPSSSEFVQTVLCFKSIHMRRHEKAYE